MSVTPSERAREIAERMVMVFPEELGSEDYGSISIGPHRDEKQPWHAWQLWVRFPDGQTAHKCAVDIRGWICDAIAAALAIPPGHVRDEHGVDTKVQGTLARTKDGVIVGNHTRVWTLNAGEIHALRIDNIGATEFGEDGDFYEAGDCYSTREAAEAARGGGV